MAQVHTRSKTRLKLSIKTNTKKRAPKSLTHGVRSAYLKKLGQTERSIKKAIEDRLKRLFRSLKAAAEENGVSFDTVSKRKQGRPSRATVHVKNNKLAKQYHDALCRWIHERDQLGFPPRRVEVEGMVRHVLKELKEENVVIGKDWVRNMSNRHPELTSDILIGHVCRQSCVEDSKTIRGWFSNLQEIVDQYKISRDRIFKYDLAGFQMGQIGSLVHTSQEPSIQANPGTWVSIIECISANGKALNPFIMFKHRGSIRGLGKHVSPGWKVSNTRPEQDMESIEYEWLESHFSSSFSPTNTDEYQLLLIDGHKGQKSERFTSLCVQRNIVLVYTPRNSSYLFSGLDVSNFPSLKHFYDVQIQKSFAEVTQKERIELVEEYATARSGTTLGAAKIKKGFKNSGCSPVNSELVVSKILTYLKSS